MNEVQIKVRLYQYTSRENDLHKKEAELEINSTKVKATLTSCLAPFIAESIEQETHTLTEVYRTEIENPYRIAHYPVLRATWKALENNYRPDVDQIMADTRITLEATPPNSSLQEIYYAINSYLSTIATYPVLDEHGTQIHDPITGEAMYQEGDQTFLKATLKRLVKSSRDTCKEGLCSKWTLSDRTFNFREMYKHLQDMVRDQLSSDVPILSPVRPYVSPIDPPPLPTVVTHTPR